MTMINIDGIDYAPAHSIPNPSPFRLVIAQRGWVFVGRYSHDRELGEVTLTDASVIRRWGTTNGLPELVNGPLADTVLDPAGTVRMHELAIVATIDAAGWPQR